MNLEKDFRKKVLRTFSKMKENEEIDKEIKKNNILKIIRKLDKENIENRPFAFSVWDYDRREVLNITFDKISDYEEYVNSDRNLELGYIMDINENIIYGNEDEEYFDEYSEL